MRAITVQQPYAFAIIHGGKDVENRRRLDPWRTILGERIAIHAGKTWSDQGATDDGIVDLIGRPAHPSDLSFAFGAIIGTALVEDVHVATDDGCCGPWGWDQAKHTASVDPVAHLVLAGARATPWIECRGQLGVWRVPNQVAGQLAAIGAR